MRAICLLLALLLAGCQSTSAPTATAPPSPSPSAVSPDARARAAQAEAVTLYGQKSWRACVDKSKAASDLWKVLGNHATELNQVRLLGAKAAFQAHDDDAIKQLDDLQGEGLLDDEGRGYLQSASPYPLTVGSRWTYSISYHVSVTSYAKTSLAEEERKGTEQDQVTAGKNGSVHMVSTTKWQDGKVDKFTDDYRVKNGDVWQETLEGKPLEHPYCYLKTSAPRGTTWEQGTHRVMTHLEAQLTAKSEGSETVTTEAGTFGHCLMVSSRGPLLGYLTVQGEDIYSQNPSSVEETEWFARGVGSVKHTLAATFFAPNGNSMRIVVQEALKPGYAVVPASPVAAGKPSGK